MTDSESSLQSLMPILLRFPSDSAVIRRLVLEDEGFRILAEDYLLAHNTLLRLKKQAEPKAEFIQEYAMILRDLEGDISRFLIGLRGPSS